MFSKKFAMILLFSLSFEISANSQTTGNAKSTDGTPVHYKIFGKGKPLLIINGGPGMNSDGFEGLAKSLSATNMCILYDQRGTGKSVLNKLDSSTITMKLMMDDIECLRKELKIEKWNVLGHSFGGMVASYYATVQPDRIEKLILSSSGGIDLTLLNDVGNSITAKLSKEDQDSIAFWDKKIADGDTSHRAKLQRGMHLAPAYVINKKYIPVIAERLTQGNALVNQLIWTDLQKINYNCAAKLTSYKKQVLIIQGKEDILKPEIAERSHQAFKNSKLVFMDHCIHYGWLDNEEVYFKEINSFLSGNNS